MSSISLFDIISVIVLLLPDPKIFYVFLHLLLMVLQFDGAAVNPKGIKMLLANGLITIFINDNPVFSNGPSNLPKNPPNCIILDNQVFNNLISVDK